ncbi:MAG TPA: NPCBM/NEW2 domain-containing protein, partial [Verrucomicrobiae bacterium]
MELLFQRVGFVALIFFAPVAFAKNVSISSLDVSQMTAGWSVAKAGQSVVGSPLAIHGEKYADGVGTCPASKFRVQLGDNAKRFTAKVGVDDSAHNRGSVEFIVEGDGKILWRSGVLKGGDAAKSVNVNLDGVKMLTLNVTDAGDGINDDYADWADAKIEMNAGAVPVVLPPFEQFSVGTGNFSLNFEVGGDGRLYQRAVGAADANAKLLRTEECYPQAGD